MGVATHPSLPTAAGSGRPLLPTAASMLPLANGSVQLEDSADSQPLAAASGKESEDDATLDNTCGVPRAEMTSDDEADTDSKGWPTVCGAYKAASGSVCGAPGTQCIYMIENK